MKRRSDGPIAACIDFGSTNSLVSLAFPDRIEVLDLSRVVPKEAAAKFMPSVVSVELDRTQTNRRYVIDRAGRDAVKSYGNAKDLTCKSCHLQDLDKCPSNLGSCPSVRLIHGIKQSLYMSVSTNVYGETWDVDNFVGILVKHLLRAVQAATGTKPDTLVVGYPVVFPGCEDEPGSNERALKRLLDVCKSVSSLSEENIHLVLEPEAALRAWHTAAPVIANGSTILALDFGGGTFDAAIGHRNGSLISPELKTGVPVGGETFDARIFQNLVAPQLGIAPRDAGVWSRMSMLRRAASPNHSNVQPPAQLRPLLHSGKVYQFWDALEGTKRRLSDEDQAEFRFVYQSSSGSQELKGSVTREQFEEWVAPDMDRVFDAIDKLLQDSGVSPEDIDAVLLAGGTSQVPLFKNRLVKMFGQEKIQHTEDPYTTIAYGLAEWARENLAGLDPLDASDARKKVEPVPARATEAAHATSSGDPVADDTHGEWMGHLFDSEIQKTEPLFSDSHVSVARDDARAAEEPASIAPASVARPDETFTEDETAWLKALAAGTPPLKVLETYPNLNFLSLYSAAAKATNGARVQGADSPPARKNMAWSRDELGVVAWLHQIGTPVEVIAQAVQRGSRAVMFELVNMGLMPESALDD